MFVFGAGLGTTQAKIISKEKDLDDDVKEIRKNDKSKNSKQNFKRRKRGGRVNNYEVRLTERKNEDETKKRLTNLSEGTGKCPREKWCQTVRK